MQNIYEVYTSQDVKVPDISEIQMYMKLSEVVNNIKDSASS